MYHQVETRALLVYATRKTSGGRGAGGQRLRRIRDIDSLSSAAVLLKLPGARSSRVKAESVYSAIYIMQVGSQRKRKRGNARQRSAHGQKAVGDEKAWSMSVDHKVQADGVLDGLWQESGHCFDDLGEDAQPILQMALRWPKNEFLASESFGVEEHMLSTASGGENTEASTLSSAGAPATKRTRRNIDSEAVEDLIDIARLMGSRGRYAMDVWEEHDFLERLRSGDGTQRLRWGGGKKWTAAAAAAQRAALMKRRRQFADLGEAVADWTTLAPTYSDDQFIDSQEHQYRAEGSGVYWWSSSASSVAAAKLTGHSFAYPESTVARGSKAWLASVLYTLANRHQAHRLRAAI